MSGPRALAGLEREELVALLAELDAPAWRADQILSWFYARRVDSFDAMTNIPAALRAKLPERLALFTSGAEETVADPDGTTKLGIRLADAHTIEAVMIPEDTRRTGCVSTQVGCPIGCLFCASGAKGFARNLETHEIVEQVVHLERLLAAKGRLTHLVFMGIGEGMLNLPRLIKAIRVVNAPWGLNIGARRMTVSTVGVPNTIGKLARSGIQVNLAVSLHAPTDALRAKLIPRKTILKVDELIDEAEDYYEATGREVTYEYVLLAGMNDSFEIAEELAEKIKPCHASVNLIPYNETPGSAFRRPGPDAVKHFHTVLKRAGVPATVRRRRGSRVHAACGQLRLDMSGR
jgi:23S rRNA (adenine2503-C2)-methyltransferase